MAFYSVTSRGPLGLARPATMRRAHMASEPEVPGGPPAARGGRLDSWKEIADYLRRGLTTVQRWERQEGLPVHRHVHSLGTSVFAYAGDLERWLAGREPSAASAPRHLPLPSARPAPGEAHGGADAARLAVLRLARR